MSKKILILNSDLSGLNKYLISALKKKNWELIIQEMPSFEILKPLALIKGFNINMTKWRNKASECLEKLHKSAWVFLKKTEFCQNKITKIKGQIDLIFQFSGMFMPSMDVKKLDIPYVIYTDYTMKLTEKYPPWTPYPSQRKKWFELEKQLYSNAQRVFAWSQNTRESLINSYGVSAEKAIVAGCGLTFEKALNSSKAYDNKTVVFVGLDFERKGGFVLLEAFKKVRKTISNARLIVVGPTKGKLKINEPGVTMMGKVNDRSKIQALYNQASLFAMPSFCEPFGLVFLEAMSYKLPCISTTIDAIPEIIDDGKTGFLVPSNDSDALAEKIISLLTKEKMMKQMGEAGYARLKERFNWDYVAENINSHLRNILSN